MVDFLAATFFVTFFLGVLAGADDCVCVCVYVRVCVCVCVRVCDWCQHSPFFSTGGLTSPFFTASLYFCSYSASRSVNINSALFAKD